MKKNFVIYALVAFILFSCKKNNEESKARIALPAVDPPGTASTNELIWVPDNIFPQNGSPVTGIGMFLFSRMFFLDTKEKNGGLYLQAIHQGIMEHRVLKFYLQSGTDRITAVQYVTKEEFDTFKKNKPKNEWGELTQ